MMIKACVLVQNDKPTVYNKGTQWEKVYTGPFLYCYAQNDAAAQELADKMNKTAVGCHYYVSHQEEMGD